LRVIELASPGIGLIVTVTLTGTVASSSLIAVLRISPRRGRSALIEASQQTREHRITQSLR
jgi:hypothetical protein